MRANILMACGLMAFLATPSWALQDEKKKSDDSALTEDICGEWSYVSGQRAGAEANSENLAGTVTITDKEFRMPTGPESPDFVMAFKIDTSSDPAKIEWNITDGPVPEGKALGILKVKGDEMTLCYDPTGQKTPDDFASTENNGFHIFVLKRKAAEFDAAKLIGKWQYAGGERSGEPVDSGRLDGSVDVTKDKIVIAAGPDGEFVMSYKLDTSVSPVAIDIDIDSGPVPEGHAVGIVKVDGDSWTLCYDPTGAKRPTTFSTSAENGFMMFVMKAKDDRP